jgi:hypothetical protein
MTQMGDFINKFAVLGFSALLALSLAANVRADSQQLAEKQGLLPNAFANAADTNPGAGITPPNPAEVTQSAKSEPVAVPLPRTWEMELVGLLLVACLNVKSVRRIFI